MLELNTERALDPKLVARARRRAFARHVAEILIAMFAGMLVLGGVAAGVLALAGTGLDDASVAAEAAVMALTMTVPMVWWMRYRGHPWSRSAEMAASMLAPTAAVIALYWLDLFAGDAVLAIQHVVMIPAMVGVMLWRYDHYAAAH